MASSKVIISNLALSSLGKGTIADMTEASEAAIQCSLHFDTVTNDLLMSNHDWSHAREKLTLSETTNARSEWTYCYDLPGDFKRIIKANRNVALTDDEFRQLVNSGLDVAIGPYLIAKGKIFSHYRGAVLNYIREAREVSEFTDSFIYAHWNTLAARVCFALTKDEAKTGRVEQKAYRAVLQAEAADANNDENSTEFIPDHIMARR